MVKLNNQPIRSGQVLCSEEIAFLFRYKSGTVRSMSDQSIIRLLSAIPTFNLKIIQKSKSILNLLMELPDYLFAYVHHQYLFELSPFFSTATLEQRVGELFHSNRFASLRLFLEDKPYTHCVNYAGAQTYLVSFEKKDAALNRLIDCILYISEGGVQSLFVSSFQRYSYLERQYRTVEKAMKKMHHDLSFYEEKNSLRMELVR